MGNAASRIYYGIHDSIAHVLFNAYITVWDTGLTLGNLVLPNYKKGFVISSNLPGGGGLWPEFQPPKATDSRSPCPALNALANHGILPRDGRNIRMRELAPIVVNNFNFSMSFAVFTCMFVANGLSKSYKLDTFDLSDLNAHNMIEHDASLTRYDLIRQPDQSKPAIDLIEKLLANATGKDENGKPLLTVADLSRYSTERRNHSKQTNGQYMLDTMHAMFGSSNSATMVTIFGGRVDDLAVILKEERLPDGWEPRYRGRNGLTIATFNATAISLELGIKETRGPRTLHAN